MKLLGKLLCKFLTYWFVSKQEREQELQKCLEVLEPKNVEKTTQNLQLKNFEFRGEKGQDFRGEKERFYHWLSMTNVALWASGLQGTQTTPSNREKQTKERE